LKDSISVFYIKSLIFKFIEFNQELSWINHCSRTIPVTEIIDGFGIFNQIWEATQRHFSLQKTTDLQKLHQNIESLIFKENILAFTITKHRVPKAIKDSQGVKSIVGGNTNIWIFESRDYQLDTVLFTENILFFEQFLQRLDKIEKQSSRISRELSFSFWRKSRRISIIPSSLTLSLYSSSS